MRAYRFLFMALLFVPLGAFGETYKIDTAHSRIAFSLHQFVSTVRGDFHRFSGTIEVDLEHPERSSVTARISVASIDTKNDMRNGHLQGEGWFDAGKYPTLAFKSTSFTKVDGKNYKLTGDLTLHGVTKPVTLNVVMNGPVEHPFNKKPLVGFKFTGKINRADFTVGKSGNVPVSEEVTLNGNAEFNK